VDVAMADGDMAAGPWGSLGLDAAEIAHALEPGEKPRVEAFDDYFHLAMFVVEEKKQGYERIEVHALVGDDWIVTAHQPSFDLLDSFNGPLKGETDLGELDGAVFLATLLNWLLNGYFRLVGDLEERVDKLDEKLLTRGEEVDEEVLLRDLVQARRRVSGLRRLLAPHREVFAILAQPDSNAFTPTESSGSYEGLAKRLEKAIDSVDQVREMLIGSFEVFMTQTAQKTNDVMKVLTVVSVLLLPAVVIAGIMGMNFRVGLFEVPAMFWVTIAIMLVLAATTLAVARWRKWI
jgi:magnesium transporter